MDNRFKFRAYIKKYNKLVDVYNFGNDMGVCQWVLHSSIYDTPDGKPVLDDWGSVDERFSNIINRTKLSDCILEQCTGLKDKNGFHIYEGDIVKEKFMGERIIIVKWLENKCGFNISKQETFDDGRTQFTDNPVYEIIGNIHENPELLEDK